MMYCPHNSISAYKMNDKKETKTIEDSHGFCCIMKMYLNWLAFVTGLACTF